MAKTVERLKEEGNALFSKGDNAGASAAYTEALSMCAEEDKDTRRVLHSNRSNARLKAGDASGALKDAEVCLQLGPGWSKGFFRRGSALLALGRYAEAATAMEGALLGEPENATYKEYLEKAKSGLQDPASNVEQPSSSSVNIQTVSPSNNKEEDDPLAAFFQEVAEIEKASSGPVLAVDHEAETRGWNSQNQIERILQKHHKFLNLNPYHVFGLGHQANEEDIKKRYHKLSGLVHPDKNMQEPLARDAFEYVKKAYDELKNEERRALLLQTFEVCRSNVERFRMEELKKLGNREDLLIEKHGTLEEALDKEIKLTLGKQDYDRQQAEKIRAKNEEAIAKTLMSKEPNWAEMKREQDAQKEGADDRLKKWSEFQNRKRQKKF